MGLSVCEVIEVIKARGKMIEIADQIRITCRAIADWIMRHPCSTRLCLNLHCAPQSLEIERSQI